jgi:hypothetical protein
MRGVSSSTKPERQTMKSTTSKIKLPALALLACTSLLIVSCADRHDSYFIDHGYLSLKAGQTYTAPSDVTLATQGTIAEKDQQILDLLKALAELQRRLDLVQSP